MTRASDGRPSVQVVGPLFRIVDELAEAFHGVFGRATIERYVDDTYELLAAQATVRAHLIPLTARFAKQRLIDHGRLEGLSHVTVPQVLFSCVHNGAWSHMAAALLDHHARGNVNVRCAGSHARPQIPATIIDALRELDVHLERAFPQPLTDDTVRAADVVVTMGCGDACPFYPGKVYLDWVIADPADAPIEIVRRIRDDLDHRVRDLLTDLRPD